MPIETKLQLALFAREEGASRINIHIVAKIFLKTSLDIFEISWENFGAFNLLENWKFQKIEMTDYQMAMGSRNKNFLIFLNQSDCFDSEDNKKIKWKRHLLID